MNRQKGLTLIEVLIALVVISVGLLGVAGLQVAGLRFNQVASIQSTATILVNNMAAAMRANYAGVTAKDYIDANGGMIDTGTVLAAGAPSTFCRAQTDNCDGKALAAADLWQWAQNVSKTLPNGKGTISCNMSAGTCAADSSYTIQVSWNEKTVQNGVGAIVTQSFQTVFQP